LANLAYNQYIANTWRFIKKRGYKENYPVTLYLFGSST